MLYHMKPFDMRGDVLYPLNAMKDVYPDIYEKQLAKYDDHPSRKKLPLRRIPKLGCLWNDVIQCAPVHPHLIYDEITKRGLKLPPQVMFYAIPVEKIAHLPVVVYRSKMKTNALEEIPEDLITPFDPDTYEALTAVPPDALAWYDSLVEKGRVFGHFVGIPHVLIQGTIDVSDVETIVWSESP